jgi:Protein of unknown function (DUF2975)
MRKNQFNNWWIVTGLFVAGVLYLTIMTDNHNRSNVPQTLLNKIKPDPVAIANSSTSLHEFNAKFDSLLRIEQWKKWRLTGVGEGQGSNFFGVRKIIECDSCGEIIIAGGKKSHLVKPKYFFVLNHFTLKNDASFIIEKDKYIIEYTVWDRITEDGGVGHPEYKEVNVRFASDFQNFKETKTSLLIPISKKAYQLWNIFSYLLIPFLIILSWIVYILPIKVLYRISMGNFFSPKNVSNLRLAGWTLITVTLIPIVLPILVKLFMGNKIPEEIYFPVDLALLENKGWLVGGIALIIISFAFKKGTALQQDQDLTV